MNNRYELYPQILLGLLVLLVARNVSADKIDDDLQLIRNRTKLLMQQLMMQQFLKEERVRSEGQSGVKAKRFRYMGTRSYHTDTFSHSQFINMHDHANFKKTLGLGEFVAVINGVEFRSRHNDFGLYMPSTTSKEDNAVTRIELPEVPPEVLAKPTVEEQAVEMRQWFKAWRDQDASVRDYHKFFKPLLCYLEGAWTKPRSDNGIDEPFRSDRHQIMAKTWKELHRKTRYMSYVGAKETDENLAFLPTSIIDVINETEPVFAQWNYRILCHPVQKYIERNRLRPIDDLAGRVAYRFTLDKYTNGRGIRFKLHPTDSAEYKDGHTTTEFMDEIMGEIPGRDNYGANLTDTAFSTTARQYKDRSKMLNAGYYHRWYASEKAGRKGEFSRHRGFADPSVFMARTTSEKIPEMTVYDRCERDSNGAWSCNDTFKQRWTYAIPLEVVYLTPLGRWNPYNIRYNATGRQCPTCDGGMTKETAFEFSTDKIYYQTPASFFTGKFSAGDSDDTSGKPVGMLNATGDVCEVWASGVHVNLPEIPEVGIMRTRYPVAPVHQEGHAIWKELQALKDLLLDQNEELNALRDEYGIKGPNCTTTAPGWCTIGGARGAGKPTHTSNAHVVLTMAVGAAKSEYETTAHTHTVHLSIAEDAKLRRGEAVIIRTTSGSGHKHELVLRYDGSKPEPYYYEECDGQALCWAGHDKYLTAALRQ